MVIVYQMGKVASTAICTALQKRGLEAHQSHFLDFATFHRTIDQLKFPTLTTESAIHMSEQLQQNLLLRHRIIKRLEYGMEVRVISLARDPFSWYISYRIQNFYEIKAPLTNWLRQHYTLEGEAFQMEHFQHFFRELFNYHNEVVAEGSDDLLAVCREKHHAASRSAEHQHAAFFYPEVTRLLRPHLWFDQHFAPFVEFDLYHYPFDKEKRYIRIEQGGLKVLLLQFESLTDNFQVIGNFCGLEEFALERRNESVGKPFEQEIKQAIATFPEIGSILTDYHRSRYYRYFYG